MSAKSVRVCPACRRPAQTRPLPPEGFWQVQVLQRLGMYPYRCEACGAKFYRKVPVGEGLDEIRYRTPPRAPAPRPGTAFGAGPVPRKDPPRAGNQIPKVVAPPEATGDNLTHEDFVDLIDHISRSEKRKGLKVEETDDEEN